jgi:hypothetical protein
VQSVQCAPSAVSALALTYCLHFSHLDRIRHHMSVGIYPPSYVRWDLSITICPLGSTHHHMSVVPYPPQGASTMHGRKHALKGDQFTNAFFTSGDVITCSPTYSSTSGDLITCSPTYSSTLGDVITCSPTYSSLQVISLLVHQRILPLQVISLLVHQRILPLQVVLLPVTCSPPCFSILQVSRLSENC